jgi:hypothetical protein
MTTQIDAVSRYPISEPSVLTFERLVTETALKTGLAYYGSTGADEPSSPVNAHDLSVCKQLVNQAVRMLISDAPPSGWRWARPVAQIALYPAVDADSTGSTYVTAAAYDSSTGTTTLTLHSATQSFYPTMELRKIWLGGDPSTGTAYVVASYLGATTVQVYGAVPSTLASTSSVPVQYSMVASDFTLPANFSGQCVGVPTYATDTNRGLPLRWTDESQVRYWRQNQYAVGTPNQVAIRPIPVYHYQDIANIPTASTVSFARWRWELVAMPGPSEAVTIYLPYVLHFQDMVSTSDRPPTPFTMDEVLLAACMATAERYKGDSIEGAAWQYYQHALKQAYQSDGRSAARSLGLMRGGLMESTDYRAFSTWPIIEP